MMEDITYPDSFKHEIIAVNIGSYIFVENDVETLFGEAYLIKDVEQSEWKDEVWDRHIIPDEI